MPLLSRPAFGPGIATTFITVGALLIVWTVTWYWAFGRTGKTQVPWYSFWILGLFLTGLTFVIIGLAVGSIGRAARRSELPPPT